MAAPQKIETELPAGESAAGSRAAASMLWAAASLTLLVCLLREFVLPHTPILSWGDALGYATKGQRMLEGELPYRDFFDFVSAGTDMVYAALFRVFGVWLWVPGALMGGIAAASAVLMTWMAGRVLRPRFVFMPALLLAGFVLWGSLDPTHHWFSTLAALGAVAALFDGVTTRRLLAAGLLCGVVASFTQSNGAAVLCALLGYLWLHSQRSPGERRMLPRRVLLLCAAAFVVFAVTNGPFLIAAGWHRWSALMIVFPLRYFGSSAANNWHGTLPDFADKKGFLRWIVFPFLYLSVPLAYVWTLARLLRSDTRERAHVNWHRPLLLLLVGVALLAAVASAPSIRRLSCASPPAMLLLVWLLTTGSRPQAARRGVRIAQGLTLASVAVAAILILRVHHQRPALLTLPAGNVAIYDPQIAQVYRVMAERTRPGQWFFGLPSLTLPLGLRNPTPIEAPSPGQYTRPEQIAAVIAGLERTQPPLLLLRPSMYDPHLAGYPAGNLAPFQNYLFAHYRKTSTFPTTDEVWERVEK
jgi:hypothetical protein